MAVNVVRVVDGICEWVCQLRTRSLLGRLCKEMTLKGTLDPRYLLGYARRLCRSEPAGLSRIASKWFSAKPGPDFASDFLVVMVSNLFSIYKVRSC